MNNNTIRKIGNMTSSSTSVPRYFSLGNNTISGIGNITGNFTSMPRYLSMGNKTISGIDNITRNYTSNPLCNLVGTSTYVFATVLILIAVVATIENAVVLITMCKYKALRTPSMLLIGALASVDLLTSSVVIPLYSVIAIRPDVPWHKASRILMVVVVLISLFTVVYISLDRFLHVYYLQAYNMTRKKLCLGLFIFWAIPFLCHSLVRNVIKRTQGREAGRVAGRVSAVVVISLSIITIIVAYTGIVMMLKKHSKHVSDAVRKNYLENQSRAAKTSLIIVVVVIAMNALAIFYSIAGTGSSTVFCTMTLTTVLGSSMVNPLVYCFRMPLIRKHILQLFGRQSDEARERMLTQSNVTRTGSLTMDQNLSVKIKKKKDTLKLVTL